jgi:hypothetical protein
MIVFAEAKASFVQIAAKHERLAAGSKHEKKLER